MTRKIIFASLVIFIFACGLLAGCRAKTPSATPTATPQAAESTPSFNPEDANISKTEGQFHDTNPPSMEGPVVALDNETITLKILGREYKLTLSQRAKEEIEIFRDKHSTPVEVGSYLQISYEKTEDGGYIAYNLRFVKSN